MTTLTQLISFIKFPYLPLELRDQIWHEALPSVRPTLALYFYRQQGLWQPFELSKDHKGYSAEGGDNLGLRFRTDLIDPLDYQLHPLAVSLLWVNREARRVALKWLDEEEIQIRPSVPSESQSLSTLPAPLTKYTFSLHWDPSPEFSTLYISRSKWTEFYQEPTDKLFGPDLVGKLVYIYGHHLHSIAIPESFIRNQYYFSWLPEVIDQWHTSLKVVYVVVENDDEQHLWSAPEPPKAQAADWLDVTEHDEEPATLDNQPMGPTEALLENPEQGPWGWELITGKYQFTWSRHWGEAGEVRLFMVEHALKFEQDYDEWVVESSHVGLISENSEIPDEMMREMERLRRRIEGLVRLGLETELRRYNVPILDIRPARAIRR
ncbi:hypothetical protein V8F20_003196 [Naviculisporaceae sp. PSN 640]